MWPLSSSTKSRCGWLLLLLSCAVAILDIVSNCVFLAETIQTANDCTRHNAMISVHSSTRMNGFLPGTFCEIKPAACMYFSNECKSTDVFSPSIRLCRLYNGTFSNGWSQPTPLGKDSYWNLLYETYYVNWLGDAAIGVLQGVKSMVPNCEIHWTSSFVHLDTKDWTLPYLIEPTPYLSASDVEMVGGIAYNGYTTYSTVKGTTGFGKDLRLWDTGAPVNNEDNPDMGPIRRIAYAVFALIAFKEAVKLGMLVATFCCDCVWSRFPSYKYAISSPFILPALLLGSCRAPIGQLLSSRNRITSIIYFMDALLLECPRMILPIWFSIRDASTPMSIFALVTTIFSIIINALLFLRGYYQGDKQAASLTPTDALATTSSSTALVPSAATPLSDDTSLSVQLSAVNQRLAALESHILTIASHLPPLPAAASTASPPQDPEGTGVPATLSSPPTVVVTPNEPTPQII